MSKVLITEQYLSDIGEAIRVKSRSNEVFYPSEMADAILNIPTGSGGLNLNTSLVLVADTLETRGPVTLTATLKADYDDISPTDIDLHGFLSGATVTFYDDEGTSLYTGITNQNGIVSTTLDITKDSVIHATFGGTSDYASCISNVVDIVFINVKYAPLLDGSEEVTLLKEGITFPPTIQNGVASNGLFYLTQGWSNIGNWTLTFDYYVTGDNNGYLVIPQGTSIRDYNGIQQWHTVDLNCRNNGVTCTGTTRVDLNRSTWINVKIEKVNNTTLKVYYDNILTTTFVWNELEQYPIMCIGLDRNSSRNSASIKNIFVI